jgi:hypothetical protein
VTLSNGGGDTLTVKLVVDFPNYIPNPIPGVPENVRNSNPFALTLFRGDLYVANAGLNAVFGVDLQSGAVRTVTTFAPVPNPLFPSFGPPASDAVPDSIRVFENQFLVPLLVGFPFAPAVSSVRVVDPRSGTNQVFIGGLTRSIDILPVKERGSTHFLVLEYSTKFLAGAPGRLCRSAPIHHSDDHRGGLLGPTNMARDEKTGDIFITEIGSGRIIRVQP